MKDLIIIGAGGFGREVAWLVDDINNNNKEWNLMGFIDDNEQNHGKELNGYTVLGGFDYLNNKKNIYYVCAIGNAKVRKEIVEKNCSKYNIKPATLIHPSVIMSKKYNQIGEGCIICASNIITVNAKLGKHIIVNLDCTIGHDVIIDDYVTIYPSVNISGNCNIEEYVEVGTGAQIIQGKNIGEGAIIGAGAVVVKDIDKYTTNVGIPTRIVNN
ncbi:acetyltransferase [Clostridium perfringens]|uniref:acetyltransferase n=1 Tax=Clostridium perfringens TaxID=1502 RepID=UPI001A25F0CB|nr:acetyltransferase [Clostridium perfringens]EJT6142698.1 acetyltransferase [Clostridium perfringens]ELC8364565.1 acetyltransferase [Clostridium perfringens]ELC8365482.1 acetyltransferase [Clostridium perfringens]UBK74348.1 acetyltransferase [Clostridium perfringens]HAT4072057.1 acetyltransferase [Clostridium perfringens]